MIKIIPMDKSFVCYECDAEKMVEIVIGKKSHAICQVCGEIISSINEVKRPKWHKTPPDMPSYCDPWNNINLIAETGKEFFFWPDWVGYFEELYGVKIIKKNPKDDDMEYWADEYKKWDYK